MESINIMFPEKNKVEVWRTEVSAPGPGELLCKARKSLLSTGTETLCLKGEFDPGTNWDEWVKFPFAAGYSMQADVIAVGEGVTRFSIGDRINASIPHVSLFNVKESDAFSTPDGITDEAASFTPLLLTTQLAVRRSELRLGETVVVIGAGLIGLLTLQYLNMMGCRRLIVILRY